MKEKRDLPFSKSLIVIARAESYIVAIALLLLVWFGKDVSSIAILATLTFGTYRAIIMVYLWMAKHEHLKQMEVEYRELGLNTQDLENEIEQMETETIDTDTEGEVL